ncbi:hypothetical protein D9M68_1008680 [compost metagenome]
MQVADLPLDITGLLRSPFANEFAPTGDVQQIVVRMKSGSGGGTFPGFHPGYQLLSE